MIDLIGRGELPGQFWMGFPYPLRAKLAERLDGAQTVTTRRPAPRSGALTARHARPTGRDFGMWWFFTFWGPVHLKLTRAQEAVGRFWRRDPPLHVSAPDIIVHLFHI